MYMFIYAIELLCKYYDHNTHTFPHRERNKTFIFTFLYKHPTPIRTNRSAHVLKAIKNRHVLGKVSVVKHQYVKLN